MRDSKRHRDKEQTFELCGRRRGWDDLRGQHWNMYITICEIDCRPICCSRNRDALCYTGSSGKTCIYTCDSSFRKEENSGFFISSQVHKKLSFIYLVSLFYKNKCIIFSIKFLKQEKKHTKNNNHILTT